VELDPLSPLYTSVLGYSDYYQREYDQTIEQSNKTLEIDPRHGGAFASLGAPHWQMGNYKEAIEKTSKPCSEPGTIREPKN
jgi:tetratricopeptide (TPR) repeat protein